MWVGEIDAYDDELFGSFWDAGRRGDEHGRDFAAFWSLRAATGAFRAANNSTYTLVSWDDGVPTST